MKPLRSADIRILDCLNRHGPRNLAEIARKLGMHKETLRKRVQRLKSNLSLGFFANPYHTFLGLKKSLVFADAVPGYEETLYDCLLANDFWIYVSRYFGRNEGCYGIYTVPINHVAQFERFVQELRRLDITRNVQHYWSTCMHTVNVTKSWFDDASERWIFPWGEWVNEISDQTTELPYTLKDPPDFSMRFSDYVDLFIIKELEKDATVSLRKVASLLKMTPEAVHYHYKEHVLKNDLVESIQVYFRRFERDVSEFYVFIFRFDESDKLARFANSMVDKPFVYSLGKILNETSLCGLLWLPRTEFRNFITSLGRLIRRGMLETYEYVIEDSVSSKAQTISYEFFRDGVWVYEHKKHLENLKKIVSEATEQQVSAETKPFGKGSH